MEWKRVNQRSDLNPLDIVPPLQPSWERTNAYRLFPFNRYRNVSESVWPLPCWSLQLSPVTSRRVLKGLFSLAIRHFKRVASHTTGGQSESQLAVHASLWIRNQDHDRLGIEPRAASTLRRDSGQ